MSPVFQDLGGGLQFDLLITPWLTLSLTSWWVLTGAGILWKVRRRQTKGVNSKDASRMYCAFRRGNKERLKKEGSDLVCHYTRLEPAATPKVVY